MNGSIAKEIRTCRPGGRRARLRALVRGCAFALLALLASSGAGFAQSHVSIAAGVLGRANPFAALGFPMFSVHPAVFDALTELGEEGAHQPALAMSWRAENPTTWVFDLRQDVVFSNGEPFDATSVEQTFDYLRSREGRTTSGFRETSDVVRVDVRGPHQVALITTRPDFMLPQKLVSIKMLPPLYFRNAGMDRFSRAPIGTGPFIETIRAPGRVELARNPRAWRPPLVDRVTLVAVPDVTARAQAVLSRQVDIALDIAIEDERVITGSGGRVAALPMGQVEVIQFVTVKPSPLQDRRVRVALNYAVDRARIAKEILHGHAGTATQYISHEVFGYDPTLPEPFPYDRGKAKALLAEAGYKNGFELPIEVLNTVSSAAYEQIAADLRAVGVQVTLSRIPIEIYARNYTGGDWGGLAFHSLYNTAPPMDALRPLRVHSCLRPKPWHCDQTVAEQILHTQEVFDGQDRLRGVREIMKNLLDNPPGILLYEGSTLVALGPRVKSLAAPLGFLRYDLIDIDVAP